MDLLHIMQHEKIDTSKETMPKLSEILQSQAFGVTTAPLEALELDGLDGLDGVHGVEMGLGAGRIPGHNIDSPSKIHELEIQPQGHGYE